MKYMLFIPLLLGCSTVNYQYIGAASMIGQSMYVAPNPVTPYVGIFTTKILYLCGWYDNESATD